MRLQIHAYTCMISSGASSEDLRIPQGEPYTQAIYIQIYIHTQDLIDKREKRRRKGVRIPQGEQYTHAIHIYIYIYIYIHVYPYIYIYKYTYTYRISSRSVRRAGVRACACPREKSTRSSRKCCCRKRRSISVSRVNSAPSCQRNIFCRWVLMCVYARRKYPEHKSVLHTRVRKNARVFNSNRALSCMGSETFGGV